MQKILITLLVNTFLEQEVWRGIQEGLPAVIINPSVILGPGDWNRGSAKYFKKFGKD